MALLWSFLKLIAILFLGLMVITLAISGLLLIWIGLKELCNLFRGKSEKDGVAIGLISTFLVLGLGMIIGFIFACLPTYHGIVNTLNELAQLVK